MTIQFYCGIFFLVSSLYVMSGCAGSQISATNIARAKQICKDVSLREKYGRVGSVVLEEDIQFLCK